LAGLHSWFGHYAPRCMPKSNFTTAILPTSAVRWLVGISSTWLGHGVPPDDGGLKKDALPSTISTSKSATARFFAFALTGPSELGRSTPFMTDNASNVTQSRLVSAATRGTYKNQKAPQAKHRRPASAQAELLKMPPVRVFPCHGTRARRGA
jgi:hypothetical protein